MITVEIGPEHTLYRIHKPLLLHHSGYFRKALRNCWKEGEERKVTIDDIEPEAFDIFVDWLYTCKIPKTLVFGALLSVQSSATGALHSYREQELLAVKAYVVADRLDTPELWYAINNMLAEELVDISPWYDSVIYAFANVPYERRLLQLMVDSHCRHSEALGDANDDEEKLYPELPHELLLRVMKRYRKLREEGAMNKDLNECHYHEHVTEEDRARCTKPMMTWEEAMR
jgi:hypothetical protein